MQLTIDRRSQNERNRALVEAQTSLKKLLCSFQLEDVERQPKKETQMTRLIYVSINIKRKMTL